jgi:DNA-directed RNA polymerase subunit alpha
MNKESSNSDLSGAYYPFQKDLNKSFFVSCKESRMENPRSFYGCFYIGPFYSNQALTVANALRRTLLSEISGIAITSVEIQGVTHEYSTLSGMKESVLDLLLNLKEIVFKNLGSLKKPQLGYLQVKGPGVVRALDLKMPSFIQCVDPNQYITTLTEDGFLNLKFQVEEGKNNHKIDHSQSFPLTPLFLKGQCSQVKNMIPLFQSKINKISESSFWKSVPLKMDAVFNPIQQINYGVRPYGPFYASTRKQILVLEVWTNGSILPRQALYQGFSSLILLFSQLEKMKIFHSIVLNSALSNQHYYNELLQKIEQSYNLEKPLFENILLPEFIQKEKFSNSFFSNVSLMPKIMPSFQDKQKEFQSSKKTTSLTFNKTTKQKKVTEFSKRDIESLSLSKRCKTILKKASILTVSDLLNYGKLNLLSLRGFGKKSLIEIQENFKKSGFHWTEN